MEKSKLLIKRLELIALALGITASQIEKGCGVHRSQLPKIWKGESDPSLTKFCVLDAYIFECLSNAHPDKIAEIWEQVKKAGLDGSISTVIITEPSQEYRKKLMQGDWKTEPEDKIIPANIIHPDKPLKTKTKAKKTFDKVVKASEGIVSSFDLPKETKKAGIAVNASAGLVMQAACGCKMENNLFRRTKGCIIPKDKHYFLDL